MQPGAHSDGITLVFCLLIQSRFYSCRLQTAGRQQRNSALSKAHTDNQSKLYVTSVADLSILPAYRVEWSHDSGLDYLELGMVWCVYGNVPPPN